MLVRADYADFGCHNSIRLEAEHFLNTLALTVISSLGRFVFAVQKHSFFFASDPLVSHFIMERFVYKCINFQGKHEYRNSSQLLGEHPAGFHSNKIPSPTFRNIYLLHPWMLQSSDIMHNNKLYFI